MPEYLSPLRTAVKQLAYSMVAACGGVSTITREDRKQYPELNGYKVLQQIFHEAGPRKYSMVLGGERIADRLDEVIRQGFWIRKQPLPPYDTVSRLGTSTESSGIAWCGIFAAWVLKKSGVQASWEGKVAGPGVQELGQHIPGISSTWRDTLEVGDIGVVTAKQHHCIIVLTFPDSDRIFTVEGNIPFPNRHAIILCDSRHKADFHAAYRIKS